MSGEFNLGVPVGAALGMKLADPNSGFEQVIFAVVGAVTLGTLYRAASTFREMEDRRRAAEAECGLTP